MKLVKVLSLFLLLLPAKTLPNNSLDIPFFNYLHTSYTLLNNSVDYAWKSVCDHPYFTASITVGLCVFIPLACKLYRNYTYKLNSKINIHSTPKPIISKPTKLPLNRIVKNNFFIFIQGYFHYFLITLINIE
jgi:hypothetical protein